MASPRADAYVASSGATVRGGRGNGNVPSLLSHIGPATPEQISLFLPVSDAVPYTATATCRYKQSGAQNWTTGHPLYRIRHDYSANAVLHGFAWPIIGLTPGVTYNVEVTFTNGATVEVHTLTQTTRSLPAASGATTKTANSVATIKSQLLTLNPGDVLEIADGTYTISDSTHYALSRSGTAQAPIVIRGQSRAGTILKRTTGGFGFLLNAKHVIIENMTIEGRGGVNLVAPQTTEAIHLGGLNYTCEYITARNLLVNAVDIFFYSDGLARGVLVYDNTVLGNNVWEPNTDGPGTSVSWNDDGIHLPGEGNCGFQNFLQGFGDTFAYCSSVSQVGQLQSANAVHFYRNEVRNSCDDAFEADQAEACNTFYDNRFTNAVNCSSFDPLYGGPFLSARNVYINLYRSRPHKWNAQNSGHFLYNNTVYGAQSTRSAGVDDQGHWYQPSNGAQLSYGYRNNVHVIDDLSQPYTLRFSGFGGNHSVVDWTHNSWYPDSNVSIDGRVSAASVTAAIAATVPVAPVFSGQTEFMYQDNVTTGTPWVTPITLPATGRIELTGTHLPVPAAGSAMKNTGVAIPNITDGFSGAAPDRGAVIAGRAAVVYGDQTGFVPAWVPSTAWQWTDIPGTRWYDAVNDAGTGSSGAPAVTSLDPGPNKSYGATWEFSGPTYSKKNHELWHMGGGHAGTTINMVTKYNLHQDAPTVTMVSAPTPEQYRRDWHLGASYAQALVTPPAPYYPVDGKLYTSHTYANLQYLDATDEFVSFPAGSTLTSSDGGATLGGGPYGWMDVAALPRNGTTWRAKGSYANIPTLQDSAYVTYCAKLTTAAGDKTYYWPEGYTPRYFTYATNTYTTIGGTAAGTAVGKGAFNAAETKTLHVNGSSAGWVVYSYDLTTGIRSTVNITGASLPVGLSCWGVHWAPAANAYVVVFITSTAVNGAGGGTITSMPVYKLTMTDDTNAVATEMTMTGAAPTVCNSITGAFFDPIYNCLIVVTSPAQVAKAIKVN